ncbi:5-deoxy-glucuronate isomerase [Agromyces intestinalis]|uniref:5-deoxy-glucuronate isomerase n=1 Tax=Agromyces intestinalis TaxID=2592652 RepID=A0A5C1YH18_9MICO|nr:5-deoxy-glucuronate isomerase [Agromyces intestinalis]QEO14389.1 5-deoxy-glucuronate isomerase [Agromyces intestinalis]
MTARLNEWFHPRGTLARDGWDAVVGDGVDGWRWTGLRVGRLDGGRRLALESGPVERIVIPLAGSCTVEVEGADAGPGRTIDLAGRATVFEGPTDTCYLPVGTAAVLTGTGSVAVAEARATTRHPLRRIAAADVPVELRGGGASSRQVHNFGTPGVLAADRIIACEVITPAGCWSSHPAHKHDEELPGRETRLEEIYWFATAVERDRMPRSDADPVGFFATSSSPAGEIETRALVRTGDVALVPFGYHGPAAAAPGADLYYLNVMAGPGAERAWLISDDPTQAWVRDGWPAQGIDPRLPYGSTRTGTSGAPHRADEGNNG